MRERGSSLGRITTVTVIVGVLGFGALCCQQVLSIDGAIEVQAADGSLDGMGDGPPSDGGTDVLPPETGIDCGLLVPDDDAGCGACMTKSCCSQMSACAPDTECRNLEQCLLACGGDDACRSACVVAHPIGGQLDVPALDTCAATSCRVECGLPCGQNGLYTTPPDAAPACETCLEDPSKSACSAAQACATNLACQISGHCAYACPTPDCRAACANDGGLFVDAVIAGLQCYAPCRIGRNWTCVNAIVWPQADGGSQQSTLTLIDAVKTGAVPVPGASAEACRPGDDSCATPLSTGTSDDAGVVSLPNLGAPFVLGFQGHFEMTAPSYVQTLYYLSFPLGQPNAQLLLQMMAQANLTTAMSSVSIAPIPGRGTVWVEVEDCLQIPASEVVVKADGLDASSVVYYAASSPSLTATATDFTGWAFLYNVAAGPLTLHAIPNDTGVESSMAAVHVRPDAMTVVTLLPTEQP